MPDHAEKTGLAAASDASRRSLALSIWSLFLIADLILITRRISGEFATPITDSLAFFSTIFVAVLSWTASLLMAGIARPANTSLRAYLPQGISIAVVAMWAWPISIGAHPLTQGLLAAIVLIHAGAVLIDDLEVFAKPAVAMETHPVRVHATRQLPDTASATDCVEIAGHEPIAEFEDPKICEPDSDELVEDDESMTLWLSRRQTEVGEQIEGWARVHFALGQRETTVHVAFCPPLASSPEIETEDLDGVGLEIRVAAAFPFGARLSVRRSGELDERNADRIGFVAEAEASHRAA